MKKFRRGFTISEITISMAFVSLLLIAIAGLIVYCITLYQKGLTLRAVNNTGLEIVDELTRALSSSQNNSTSNYWYQKTGSAYLANKDYQEVSNVPYWGIFCTGTYSYAWNTGYVLNNTYRRTRYGDYFAASNRLTVSVAGTSYTNFRLLRINDSDRELCASISGDSTPNIASAAHGSNPRDLLSQSSEHRLALYDFKVFTPAYHELTGHTLFAGSFVLGTLAGSVDITTVEEVCKEPPDGLSTDFTYCAINKFNFAVRATGAN